MGIGKMIAKLRREAGYTQKTLAESLHITDKAVSKWERGICLPDSSLLPKLSALLDVDIERLISVQALDGWVGYLDLRNSQVDLSMVLYDKPVAYYILSAFLLCDVRHIYIQTDSKNEAYLSQPLYKELGFSFTFDFEKIPYRNIMALNRPIFLFGSDMTRQLQVAMASGQLVKMVPTNQRTTFLFVPAENGSFDPIALDSLCAFASERTQGRGVLSFSVDTPKGLAVAESFVKLYQQNTGLLLGSLEEIALHKGLISEEKAIELSKKHRMPITV